MQPDLGPEHLILVLAAHLLEDFTENKRVNCCLYLAQGQDNAFMEVRRLYADALEGAREFQDLILILTGSKNTQHSAWCPESFAEN